MLDEMKERTPVNDTARNVPVVCLLMVVLSFWAVPAVAGGFSQGFQGSTSAGLSGAVTGRPNMPEAGYYNPAGFAIQDEWGIGVGGSFLFPQVFHEDPETNTQTRAEVNGAFPPSLHGFGRYGKFAGGLSLGIPYGSGLQWPDDWPGRFEVTSTSLRVMEAAPSVAWRPLDWLAIGGGPRVAWANVSFAQRLDFARPEEEARVSLEAATPGFGGQLGVWAQPLDLLTVGLSWRSAMTLNFAGLAIFEDVPPEMSGSAHDTTGRTTITLPDRIAVGLAYELAATGFISVDLEYNRWSVFDTFEVRFDSSDVPDMEEARNWDNTISMRLGVEYISPFDGLAIRSGFAIDPSPAPSETLTPAQPDTDRYMISLGAGYRTEPGVQVDVAYNYITLSRTNSASDFAGIYDGQVHVFSVSVRAP